MEIVNSIEEKLHMKEFKYLIVIAMFFVAILLISNVASSKIVAFGWLSLDAGTILFPLSYIFGDVLTEVYGYRRVRKIIWTGFAMNILMAVVFMIVAKLPGADFWPNQEAYDLILGWTPRIVAASVIAYFFGEFSNSYLLAKIKIKMNGKKLWVRTISSTVVGEFFDTLIFITIAFWGVFPNDVMVQLIVSNYIFKVGVEVAFTPITYAVVGFLKKKEGVDVYDRGTNFNPFLID